MAILILFTPQPVQAEYIISEPPPVLVAGQFNELEPVVTILEAERVVPKIPPIMDKVARCESGNVQFKEDGSLLRGLVNPKDVGRFQINEYYHLEKSKELGMDIYTWEGNTEYALWLFEQEGTRPWKASKNCWNR